MTIINAIQSVNILAIIVAAIVHMLTGLIWYQEKAFGSTWSKLTGKDLNPAKQWLFVGVLGHLAIVFVLAVIIILANATSVINGAFIGILVWVGFIVPLEIGELIWEKIQFKLFIIRISEHFLSLILAGAILAIWQ